MLPCADEFVARPPMKSTPARAAAAWLDDEAAFRAVALRVDRLVELQSLLAAHFPNVPLTVVTLEAGTLTLRAPNAAWVSRLRQSAPTMLQALQSRLTGIERLRIVPQRMRDAAPPAIRAPRAAIPSAVLCELDRLRGSTDAPALGAALERLVRHHRSSR